MLVLPPAESALKESAFIKSIYLYFQCLGHVIFLALIANIIFCIPSEKFLNKCQREIEID